VGQPLLTHAFGSESCNKSSEYPLYECRVSEICDHKPDKLIFNTEESDEQKYLELEPLDSTFLSANQEKYRSNMNNLYKCALIQLQINALEQIAALKKDKEVEAKIDARIDRRIEILEAREKAIPCESIDNKEIYNKKNVLDQATYEICKYTNYLDYIE
jgi:hypothetical protein